MLPKHSQKPFSLYKFSSKHVSVWRQEKEICTTPFSDVHELHSWSTLKANTYIFVHISLKKFCLKDLIRTLSDGMGGGGRMNNFLKVARCLSLVKCFIIFHFNWNFWKFNNFSAFRFSLLSTALKHWNFPDNLDFSRKIIANFLIRSLLSLNKK